MRHDQKACPLCGGSQGQLNLTVSDRGVGFDMDTARTRGGLGLISMRERVRLVNGTISMDSKPMAGTRIHVHVPLEFPAKITSPR